MFVYCPPKELPVLESVTQPDGKRYYVSPSGKKLPSVTTVVGAQKKQALLEWRKRVGEEEANRISRTASNRGNRVHNLAEKYLKSEPIDWAKEMPDAVASFRPLIRPIHRINNIHYQENALWSETLGLAGRVDLIAEFDGVLSVIDFKTSKKPKTKEDVPEYFWQTAAYSLMYEELVGVPINQLVILMAVDGQSEASIFIERTEDHIEGLVQAIDYYNKNNK